MNSPAGAVGSDVLHALLDAASEPLFALDKRGVILEANVAAAALLGRRRAHLRGKPFAAFVAVADRRRFRTALAMIDERSQQMIEIAVASDVTRARCSLELRLVTSGGTVVAAMRDVPPDAQPDTEMPRAPANAARACEAMLSRLPLAAVRLTSDGTVVYANAAAVARLSPIRVGQPLAALLEGPLQPHVERLLANPGVLPPRVVQLEDAHCARVCGFGPRGHEPALLVLDDVTALVRRGEAQQEFVRNASHQLRTPLAGITSVLEVLRAGAQDDPAARERFLGHLAQQTDRLTRLTRALLVLARAQSGTQAPRLEFVTLAPLLERLAAEVPHRSSVSIEASAPPNLAAFVDADLLEEALHALAENAVRHTREGTVTLRAWRRDDRLLEIEVADSGDGILPEHLDQIFEPFFTSAADGFGLGLAIARQAVRAMGGELDVTSEPRRGTRFSILVPSAEVIPT